MPNVAYRVSADFHSMEDAVAFRDLALELGVSVEIYTRDVEEKTYICAEQRLGSILLDEMRKRPNGTLFMLIDLGEICEQHNYRAKSAAPTITRLIEEGHVERPLRGVYRLTSNVYA